MPETPLSLLERVSKTSDPEVWRQLVDLYAPLLRQWLRRMDIPGSDIDDLIQEVFVVVIRELPHFHHNHQRGAFRNWLRTTVVHRVLGYRRQRGKQPRAGRDNDSASLLEQLQAPGNEQVRQWDQEHDRLVLSRLLAAVQGDFDPRTWQAFSRLVFANQSAAKVATQLGMSVAAVHGAKSRVLRRLRQEAAGLVD